MIRMPPPMGPSTCIASTEPVDGEVTTGPVLPRWIASTSSA